MPHLVSLPPEILYTIITFLEPAYTLTEPLTLLALSATSKHLNALVEEHANNALKKHGLPLPKRVGKLTTLRRKWLGDICQFCRKASKRRACFYSDVVCCKHCDRALFPKMTMTTAVSSYHLSKLDLFTPNALHPFLDELRVGTSYVMGGQATMISEPDVLARRDHIHALLGDKAHDPAILRIRPAAHNRIIVHLFIIFCPVRKRWCRTLDEGPVGARMPGSMRTRESRLAYARKALRLERMALGVDKKDAGNHHGFEIDHAGVAQGESVDAAIELESDGEDEEGEARSPECDLFGRMWV